MAGNRKVRAVSDEITKANEFMLSPVDPKEEQADELKAKILAMAKGMRKQMDEMFRLTRWNHVYKKLHRDLRTIIFDE